VNYRQSLDFLFPLHRFGIKPGLDRVGALLDVADHPHKRLGMVIHIAGTNGKGTVAAALASMFTAAGYRTGLYTSPHLVSFTERMRVDGRMIPEERVAEYCSMLQDAVQREGCTFFEATTAMAFRYFADEEVEVSVVETGMGGRLDATNVVHPRYVVIPSIGLDHTGWLGSTLDLIAAEKAAIIKEGCDVYTAVEDPLALQPITEAALKCGAPLHRLADEVRVDVESEELGELRFCVADEEGSGHYRAPVSGVFHAPTLALAERVARHAGLSLSAVEQGFLGMRSTGYRGRLERLSSHPELVLDVSHNADGIRGSVEVIGRMRDRYRNIVVVLGLADDKDAGAVISELGRVAGRFVTVTLPVERGVPAEQLAGRCRDEGFDAVASASAADALGIARASVGVDDLVLVTGSFYLAGELLEFGGQGGAGFFADKV